MKKVKTVKTKLTFKNWDKISKKLKEDIIKSQRITAEDLAIVINCKD